MGQRFISDWDMLTASAYLFGFRPFIWIRSKSLGISLNW